MRSAAIAAAGVLAAVALFVVPLLLRPREPDTIDTASTRSEPQARPSESQEVPGPSSPVVNPESRSAPIVLAGRVVDEEGPLAGEEIRVEVDRGARASVRRVTTGSRGEFRIEVKAPGECKLTVEHALYATWVKDLNIQRGEPSPSLEVSLERGLRVAGAITNLDGHAAAAMIVEWASFLDQAIRKETTTDSEGRYELGGLDPGRYEVYVYPRRLRRLWKDRAPREVILPLEGERRFDFAVEVGNTLAVEVVSRERGHLPRPAAKVAFRVKTPTGGVAGLLLPTDSRGRTTLPGLPARGTLVLQTGDARLELDLETLPTKARLAVR